MDQNIRRAQLDLAGESHDFALTHPSLRDRALLEELSFVRREAQAEANLAYSDWRGKPCRDRWTVYVAAQDAPTQLRMRLPRGRSRPPWRKRH
jgi:hypothetical protein